MEYNYRPLGDRVVVEILKRHDEKTKGGLYKPSGSDTTMMGKVVAVGSGLFTQSGVSIPMSTKVGDIVLFGKWSGTEVKIDGKEYSIMKESDIMGISKSKK